MKKLIAILMLLPACSDLFLDDPTYMTLADVPQAVTQDIIPVVPSEQYKLDCYRTEYYFCPGVNGPLYRIAVVKDVCKDPREGMG